MFDFFINKHKTLAFLIFSYNRIPIFLKIMILKKSKQLVCMNGQTNTGIGAWMEIFLEIFLCKSV